MPYEQEGTFTPDWADTPEKNADHLDYLLELNPKVITKYKKGTKNWEVNYVTDNDLDIYFVHDFGLIQYCVEVETFNLTGELTLKTVAQTSVWRNKDYLGLFGIANWLFINILFPQYGTIMSDNIQSRDGKRFWANRVSDMLESNIFVYGITMLNNKTSKVNLIVSEDDTIDFYSQGSDYSGMNKRLLISKKKLI